MPHVVRADRLGPSFDLLAAYDAPAGCYLERRGIGVAGSAPALTVREPSPDAVLHVLRGLLDDPDAPRSERMAGPVAVGALPFTAGGPWTLAVPAVGVRRTDADVTWRTTLEPSSAIDRADPTTFSRVVAGAPHEAFSSPQLEPVPADETYAEAVHRATERIRSGALRKVVLARTIEVDAGRHLDPRRLAHRLRAVDPDAYTFAVPTPRGVLVGASPELLVSRHGREVRANPLAGSAARAGDPERDRALARALESSAKDHEEHAIVVEAIAATLDPFCEELRWDPEPVLLETANVWHLSTRFHGLLRAPAPSVLHLVEALHPTPAVGGAPRDVALGLIAELEPFDRGAYAGPVGWLDASGDGEWAIALRCAELRGDHATLYAGAGIVADSDPAAELAETDRKFRAFLDALRWG